MIQRNTSMKHVFKYFAMLSLTGSLVAFGQQAPARKAANSTAKVVGTDRLAKPEQRSEPINLNQATYLVRSTLMMLNDANRSGNYSVLRDLAAPDFQARNSAADLAQSFADLRSRKFDLFAAAILTPQFTAAPALDADGRLHLAGFFPTSPLRIKFLMTFQSVSDDWRLLALAVATPSIPTALSQNEDRIPPRSRGLFYRFQAFSGTAGLRW